MNSSYCSVDSNAMPIPSNAKMVRSSSQADFSSANETESFDTARRLSRFFAKMSVFLLALVAVSEVLLQSEPSDTNLFRSSGTRLSLGSAAINSVTETLSPILPFTGGIDLRKEDYWSGSSALDRVQSLATQLWEAYTLVTPVIPDNSNPGKNHSHTSSIRFNIAHSLSISSSEGFMSPQDIGELTLAEVGTVLQFALYANREGFDETKLLKREHSRVRKVVLAMKSAVEASAGKAVKLSVGPPYDPNLQTSGSVDALVFCAAMRVFGEWRVIRQVPDGYKTYAVGLGLGLKDIVQNVAKVENAVHQWIDLQQVESLDELHSPTLAEIMEYEAQSGLHPSLPRLKDKTGAMGLLWTRRQLMYQYAIFQNLLKGSFPTAKDAVSSAYEQVYNRYHGWAVQKIFSYSFQAAPQAEVIYRHMNPHKMAELAEKGIPTQPETESDDSPNQVESADDKNFVVAWFQKLESTPIGLWWKDLEDKVNGMPLVVWWKDVEREIDEHEVVVWFKKVGDETRRFVDDLREKLLPPPDKRNEAAGDLSAGDSYIDNEMTKDAHENIRQFLETASPLLDDIARAFVRFNMDDPTKV